jgi:AraC-like DNA-binding protein
MDDLAPWSRFMARQMKNPPLVLLSGVRHSLRRTSHAPMHSHPAIEIVYHPTGKGVTRLKNKRVIPFSESDIVVYAPNEMHDQQMEIDGEDLCLRIGIARGRRDVPKSCFAVTAVEDPTIIDDIRMLSLGRGRISPAEQTIFNLRATSTIHALVHLACSRHQSPDEPGTKQHVLKAEDYIRRHFSTIKTLPEVSGAIGISYDHLRHAFKQLRGMNLVRYLNDVRMDHARTLLVHSRLPLKQVATMCGFSDEYYFSAVFRSFAGIPPGRYRARLS